MVILSWMFIVMSILLFALAISLFLKPNLFRRSKSSTNVGTFFGNRLMIPTLVLLLSIWTLRFVIGAYGKLEPTETIPAMPLCEQFFNSFLHALQTFSMDEDYTQYMEHGKKLIDYLLAGKSPVVPHIFAIYISLLNFISPIVGGAFVFEILAGIFPRLHYWVSCHVGSRTRYYFTALNEQSLALANSIVNEPAEEDVLLIFTDAYADDEDEKSSELLLSAKALGAICLKDDLLHIPLKKSKNKKTHIFLSDREENENLRTLSKMLNDQNINRLLNDEGTVIRVFGTDKKQSYIEDEVIYIDDRLRTENDNKTYNILPVNSIRNMAQKLFCDLPLFEGQNVKCSEKRQINLTIIGSGVIGTEMFLNAYWMGQMPHIELNISVVSANETKNSFIRRIDGINPEIMATSIAGNEVLNAYIGENEETKKNTPIQQPKYFTFRFSKTDVLKCDLKTFLEKELPSDQSGQTISLRDTDYFVVAAGSDEINFRIADRLRQEIGYYHLNVDKAQNKKTIISFVIYNSSLCKTLNASARQKYVKSLGEKEFDIYMHAFGSMDEIYSAENILRYNLQPHIQGIEEQYRRYQPQSPEQELNGEMKKRRYYNARANLARRLQIRYKAYIAGNLCPMLFYSEDDLSYQEQMTKAEFAYAKNIDSNMWNKNFAGTANVLAWMEHRRWNAFMRMNGFVGPDNVSKYYDLDSDVRRGPKKHQFLFIKRHGCVVEADLNSYPGIDCKEETKKVFSITKQLGPDGLDRVKQKTETDYKEFDYPDADVKTYIKKSGE